MLRRLNCIHQGRDSAVSVREGPGQETPMTAAIHPLPTGRGKSAQRSERLRLSFLVDLRDVLRVRRAIVALAHPSVDIVTLTRVSGDSRVQMTIGLEPGIAGETMDRLMRGGECRGLRRAGAGTSAITLSWRARPVFACRAPLNVCLPRHGNDLPCAACPGSPARPALLRLCRGAPPCAAIRGNPGTQQDGSMMRRMRASMRCNQK